VDVEDLEGKLASTRGNVGEGARLGSIDHPPLLISPKGIESPTRLGKTPGCGKKGKEEKKDQKEEDPENETSGRLNKPLGNGVTGRKKTSTQ